MTNFPLSKDELLKDYHLAYASRQASLIGRKEVLNGRAKFGIFGDGKEVAQIAMARAFKKGDWRGGYYRDQTLMFALKKLNFQEYFAQLYADTNPKNEPASCGRQMNCHFATRYLDDDGNWLPQHDQFHSSADISPTAGQMARLLGLAYASKLYKESATLQTWGKSAFFSHSGHEVVFGTIGNASTSEGIFWEALNAAGVLQVPLAMSVWDDGYGISVPNEIQTTKGSISELLAGFVHTEELKGIDLYQVKGYDYNELYNTYQKAIAKCRSTHIPCVIHVTHMTQPQGHSTSGSHERYKTKERLRYEEGIDCLKKMREWLLSLGNITEKELDTTETAALSFVEKEQKKAWENYQKPIDDERSQILKLFTSLIEEQSSLPLQEIADNLQQENPLFRRSLQAAIEKMLLTTRFVEKSSTKNHLLSFFRSYREENQDRFNSYLYSQKKSPLQVTPVAPTFSPQGDLVDGRQIIQRFFEHVLAHDPRVFIIGEDVGKLGGVNLEFDGLQGNYGPLRVSDTGIREATILGQGIGSAMRGLRPIVDIQYLDYLLYCLQGLSDDLATLHYRTKGGQTAPVIVRTKGHRLEGIWHTGSPLGMILSSLRGMHICVPRNGVQAAGFYQTLLQGDDPALVIEVLNGYRLKENCPTNLGKFSLPLGICEVMRSGTDVTIVTYGANVRIGLSSAQVLASIGIEVEVIDVQTLLPFDLENSIASSIAKTHAVVFFDEDVSGGASAYMMQKVLEGQNAFDYLELPPRTLSAKDHRSAYASDGDYFSKPNQEDLIRCVYEMMEERFPTKFPRYW